MGKVAKKKRSDKRKEAKKAKKLANYLRTGPKAESRKKRTRINTHHSRPATGPHPPTPPGIKARRRRKGLKINTRRTRKIVNFPLRKLRKRNHICTTSE